MYGGVLPGLQGGRDGLEMAEVVGLEGVVVAGAERGSRLDHLRHAARVRHRKPLAPVGDERLLLTAGSTDRSACLLNDVDQLVREAAAVLGRTTPPGSGQRSSSSSS